MDRAGTLIGQWLDARPGTDITGMVSTARITRLRSRMAQAFEECHQQAGMASWAFDVLATLRRQPAPHRVTHKELSELAMISNSAVTQRIDKLVAEDLVARVPNPASRREMFVQLTDRGMEAIEAVIDRHTALCNELMAPLTGAEHAEFDRLLVKLLEPLDP
jgi:DNA-binding MarR family transcriptional regulator